jgi:hypothetical protein
MVGVMVAGNDIYGFRGRDDYTVVKPYTAMGEMDVR